MQLTSAIKRNPAGFRLLRASFGSVLETYQNQVLLEEARFASSLWKTNLNVAPQLRDRCLNRRLITFWRPWVSLFLDHSLPVCCNTDKLSRFDGQDGYTSGLSGGCPAIIFVQHRTTPRPTNPPCSTTGSSSQRFTSYSTSSSQATA